MASATQRMIRDALRGGPLTIDEILAFVLAQGPLTSKKPKQTLRNAIDSDYIFDFGDELRHEIEVIDIIPAPSATPLSRITQSHGEAPPQYGDAEEDDEDLYGETGDDEDEPDNKE